MPNEEQQGPHSSLLATWEVFPLLLQGNQSKCQPPYFTLANDLNEVTALGGLVVGRCRKALGYLVKFFFCSVEKALKCCIPTEN